MAVRTNLMLPPELVAEVDRIAGPRNRSRYVAEAVQARLRRDHLKEVWDRSFGILKAEDHPEWATSEMVVEWVRALRAEETDPGPDPIPVMGQGWVDGSPRDHHADPR
jgi:metal-responsive CopG/Arc/MetJ family transcriptional regulator